MVSVWFAQWLKFSPVGHLVEGERPTQTINFSVRTGWSKLNRKQFINYIQSPHTLGVIKPAPTWIMADVRYFILAFLCMFAPHGGISTASKLRPLCARLANNLASQHFLFIPVEFAFNYEEWKKSSYLYISFESCPVKA